MTRRSKRAEARRYFKRAVGAPKGSTNGATHGLSMILKKRRNGSIISRRTRSGQNALTVQAGLIEDLGGETAVSTATKLVVEMITRDVAFLDEIDWRIFQTLRTLKKQYPKSKGNARILHTLYSYRGPVAGNLSRNLSLLGLEKKPPPQKTLEELLTEDEGKAGEPKAEEASQGEGK